MVTRIRAARTRSGWATSRMSREPLEEREYA
jgi:hypothetical protein